MSEPEPPSFHLRLPADLKTRLEASRGSKSLNREIVDRLERTFDSAPASRLAEIVWPLLSALDDDDRSKVLELVAAAVAVVAKGSGKRRR